MPHAAHSESRRFSVHATEAVAERGQMVEGPSFHDAALQFAEEWGAQDADGDMSVIVEDCETGERQCFRIDLDSGETEPCE